MNISTRHSDQRVGIFLDAQNLYHAAKNLFKARVNYRELLRELVADRRLIRAIAYVVKSDDQTGEELFFEALEKTGIELRSKDIQIFPGGIKKADWDVGMAVDAIRMADFLDVIVLVTGDGDFIPLVEYLKWGTGRSVEVAAFSRSCSTKLREAADAFTNLDDLPRLLLRNRSGRPNETGNGSE